jgi:release factor glutamine methyltransferase
MNIATALRQGVELLDKARVPAARLTAEVLLCHALRRERSYLYGHPEEELSETAWIHYGRYLHERIEGKPTQYITRQQEFYGRMFAVSPAVLIPRPETEHVVETVLKLAQGARRAADIGCGSGAIAVTLALEMPPTSVWASDISGAALEVASSNARRYGAAVGFVQADLCAAFRPQSLDVIACNPPYVPLDGKSLLQAEVRDHEPELALYGGPRGTEIYERLIPEAARVLRPGGWLVVELGYHSLEPVQAMLGPGWTEAETVADLAGIPRVLAARLET